jgi:dissimilatory sulfite reductase related protein
VEVIMETTKNTTDPAMVDRRLAAMEAQLTYLVERQKKTEELFSEMTPILREVMATATTRLGDLDERGYFAFGKELLAVSERVIEGFSPDDVRKLGDAIVGILQTVRAVTQPKVLEIASEASAVLEKSDQAEPLGLLGMVRATRDDDVQKGMAVLMEIMRHVGRAAAAVAEQKKADPTEQKRAKLAEALGPRRKKALGTERTPPRDVRPTARPPARAADLGPPPGCAVPSRGPAEVATVIEGVAFGADGHLADPKAWTPDLAQRIAALQGVALDEARWTVVKFARADFEATGASPNIRRLTQGTNLATKDVYALFPKAPARTIAKIAGIPKPAGCI